MRDIENKNRYQRKWHKDRRNEILNELGGKCAQCGSTDELEIDHIDPTLKLFKPSKIVNMGIANPLRQAEIDKCQLLCNTCHKAKTIQQLTVPHGIKGYRRGCKCDVCRLAKHDEKQRYLNKKKLNTHHL